MSTERIRAALGAEQRPATDLVLLRIAKEIEHNRATDVAGVSAAFPGDQVAAVLARLVAEMDLLVALRARYAALAKDATRHLGLAMLDGGDYDPAAVEGSDR